MSSDEKYNIDYFKLGLVEVELHSEDPDAVTATANTIAMLPNSGDGLVNIEGRWYVPSGFVAFACERQGYVRKVRRAAESEET